MNCDALLPPNVGGVTQGYLDVKISALWIKSVSGPFLVKLLWWGETKAIPTFKIDIKNNIILQTYKVCTSLKLFKNYLEKCEQLLLSVVDYQRSTVLGTCIVPELTNISNEKPYQTMSVIKNSSGSKIGSLNIEFRLCMKIIESETVQNQFKINETLSDSNFEFFRNFNILTIGNKDFMNNRLAEKRKALRNSIVESLLENDPSNIDMYLETITNKEPFTCTSNENKENKYKLSEYVLCDSEEQKITKLLQNSSPTESVHDIACNSYLNYSVNSKKQLDSLKIYLYSITLNSVGWKKAGKSAYISVPSRQVTVFVEYTFPEKLVKDVCQSKAKVYTGLNSNRKIQICSKQIKNGVVQFNHHSNHKIKSILSSSETVIDFHVYTRSPSQKTTKYIGIAKCSVNKIKAGSDQELIIHDPKKTIVLGSIKIQLQFGCDKKYTETVSKDNSNNGKSTSRDSVNHEMADTLRKLNINIPSNCLVNRFVEQINTSPSTDCSNTQSTVPISKSTDNCSLKQYIDTEDQNNTTTILLEALIYVPAITHDISFTKGNIFLTYRAFWKDETTRSKLIHHSQQPLFKFFEVKQLVCNNTFLRRTKNNFLIIELWHLIGTEERLLGICKLSLHHFFVAYRDRQIAVHLLQKKSPVIGFDGWESITDPLTSKEIGQLEAVLAIGTNEQIEYLKLNRVTNSESILTISSHRTEQSSAQSSVKTFSDKGTQSVELISRHVQTEDLQKNMSEEKNNLFTMSQKDLLDSFIQTLTVQPQIQETKKDTVQVVNQGCQTVPDTREEKQRNNIESQLRDTSELFKSLEQALSTIENNFQAHQNVKPAIVNNCVSNKANVSNVKELVKVHIFVENAVNLSICKKKYRHKTKNNKCYDGLPSTYVSFEPVQDKGTLFTSIVQKSLNPVWNNHFEMHVPLDFLVDGEKRLIFKIWNKTSGDLSQPTPGVDSVIGFAAVDLTVLYAGMPSIHGWFNIMDFSGRCNGQIKINVNPLENIINPASVNHGTTILPSFRSDVNAFEDTPSTLISNTLKRKFFELDEITERLKLRLMNVTSDGFENVKDDFVTEFERDINVACDEDEDTDLNLSELIDNDLQIDVGHKNNASNKNLTKGTACKKKKNHKAENLLQESKGSVTEAPECEKLEDRQDSTSISSSELEFRLNETRAVFDALTENINKVTTANKTNSKENVDKIFNSLNLNTIDDDTFDESENSLKTDKTSD